MFWVSLKRLKRVKRNSYNWGAAVNAYQQSIVSMSEEKKFIRGYECRVGGIHSYKRLNKKTSRLVQGSYHICNNSGVGGSGGGGPASGGLEIVIDSIDILVCLQCEKVINPFI